MCIGPNGGERRRWHFEKSVSAGHIIGALAIVGSFVLYAQTVENRFTKLEVTVAYTKEALKAISDDVRVIANRVMDVRGP